MPSEPYNNPETKNKDTASQIHISVDTEHDAADSDHIQSVVAVWRALFANIGIAGIKFTCWLISHSSAMLSESIHSAADSFNSICLLVGLKRGSRPADKLHPFGYGLEANIWALFACILMLIGTFVSISKGIDRFFHQGEIIQLLNNYNVIAITLFISILFEFWAVTGASHAVLHEADIVEDNKVRGLFRSFKYINSIKSPTTKFVWYEDMAALAGVVVALIALTISKFFVSESLAYIPDAVASIIIGLILLLLAVYLLKNNVNALTGASAKPQVEQSIRDIATKVRGVSHLHELKTMDMGTSGLIVNMKIEVDPETQVKDADDIAEKLEEKIKNEIKDIAHVTIEMQADDAEDNWNEKFEKLIREGKKIGLLKNHEAKMLSKFYDFTDTVVNEIMIPRTEISFIDVEDNIDELIELIISKGHTRIPVYQDTTDNILGVVNAKDVLRALKENGWNKDQIKISDLVRDITIVPENKSISDMLNDFTVNKTQISLIVDEHGGVAGIVTVEDILEEIVGEIWDEFDIPIAEIIRIDDNTVSVLSKMDIYEFNEKYSFDLPTEEFNTIGGYVFGLIGREPEVNDEVESGELKFKIESMDGHKIVRVIVHNPDGIIEKQAIEEEI